MRAETRALVIAALIALAASVTIAACGRSSASVARTAKGSPRADGAMSGRRADALASGLAALPRDRQRRLHEPAHAHPHGLRRRREPVPAGEPGRPHRPSDEVPDELQPRLRAPFRQYQRRPGHVRRLGARERPPGQVPLRPADLPRGSERAERPRPGRPRGVADEPRRRPEPQPASAGLLARAALAGHARQLAQRDAVPGQQAGDRPRAADPRRRPRSGCGSPTSADPGLHNDGDGFTEGWFRSRRRRLRHDRAGRRPRTGCR